MDGEAHILDKLVPAGGREQEESRQQGQEWKPDGVQKRSHIPEYSPVCLKCLDFQRCL
jgi:hypothetical protein